jgi:tetratricopeptide (TPR) repeat protein
MMAGRAAVARLGYSDARDHFTNLTSSLTCPADLKAEALFAYGDVLAHLESTETNKPLANVEEAIRVFSQICQLYPTNQQAALAGGEIGDCYLQLAASDPSRYESASNAFQQVITSTNASVAARSQAEFGLGLVAEKLAQLKTDPEQTALLKLARSDYYDVFKGNHLREGEKPDLFWTKKAGLDAARLTEQLQEWPQLVLLYQDLTKTNALPQLRDTLEKKIDKIIREHPEAGRK